MKLNELEKICEDNIEKIKKLNDIDNLKRILSIGCKLLDNIDISIDEFTKGKINEEITVEELRKVNIILQEYLLYMCKFSEKLSDIANPIIDRYDSKCENDTDDFFDELHKLIDKIKEDIEN